MNSAEVAVREQSALPDRTDLLHENAELRVALDRQRSELDQLRRDYATVMVRASEQAEELTDLQVRVAVLLDEYGDQVNQRVVAEAIARLAEMREARAALIVQLRAFAQYLEAMLDVLQPSTGLRREMTDRFASILRVANRLEQVPSLVAGRDGVNVATQRTGRVLAVNDELQLVVLDIGSEDGVRLGMVWEISDKDQTLAQLRVIVNRNAVCATVPVAGRLSGIAPGMEARLKTSQQE